MSHQISKGDLVMVVRPLPCGHGEIGTIGRVASFFEGSGGSCAVCGTYFPPGKSVLLETGRRKMPERLIRIDPSALKDDIPADEEVHA